MIRTLSRAVSIAKSAIRGPTYGRENGAENHEHYQNERRNVSLPRRIIANHNPEEGYQQSNDPNCEDSQASFGLGIEPPFFPRLRQNRASFRTVSGKTMLRCRASMSSIYSSRS
jgi:hypothetical protein